MRSLQTIATSPSVIRAGCQKCQELTATVTRLQGEAKVLEDLLTSAIDVIKVIEPESTEERALLETLVAFAEAAMRVPPYDDLLAPENCGSGHCSCIECVKTDWSAA